MSASCNHDIKFDGVDPIYKRILLIVIAINAIMFVVEMLAGIQANSQALQADALDFLGDTFTYAISLWVIGKPITTRSNAALFKGYTLLLISLWVFASTLYQLFILNQPSVITMGSIAIVAFLANISSALLLMKYKDGDANVRSVWLCSRNDAIGNLAVLASAVLVWYSNTPWPDLIVAMLMAGLFLSSAIQIIRQASLEKSNHA